MAWWLTRLARGPQHYHTCALWRLTLTTDGDAAGDHEGPLTVALAVAATFVHRDGLTLTEWRGAAAGRSSGALPVTRPTPIAQLSTRQSSYSLLKARFPYIKHRESLYKIQLISRMFIRQ